MVAVKLQQPLADHQPQPEEQRAAWDRGDTRQAGDGIDVSLLDHVGSIDPRLQPAVQADLDHPAQPAAVTGENLVQRGLVAGPGEIQQSGRLGGIVLHREASLRD